MSLRIIDGFLCILGIINYAIKKLTGPMKNTNLLTEGDVNFSAARTGWYDHLDNDTRQWLRKDNELFLHQSLSTPCLDVLESCEGIWLVDTMGRRYMDFHGNNVHQVGHRNAHVIQRLKDQLDILPFSPRRYTNQPAIDLAAKLTGLLPPGLNRVLYAPGGTSAISMALKLARVVTGRYKVVSFIDSFHGASLDAITAGGEEQFRKYMGPLHPETIHITPPVTYGNAHMDDAACADALEEAILREGGIGAFIAETIRNTDVQVPSKAYWQRVREICDRHKVLLILDEIPIAFGRTGKMFAFEHYGIVPDILCLGKGLGAGVIPFAAMVTKDEFNIAQDVSLGHFTHEKSPLGSVAALAMLEFMEQQRLLEKVRLEQSWIEGQLLRLQEKHALIGDVRGIGFLWAIELVRDRHTKEKAVAEAEQVLYGCLDQGLSFKVSQGNVLQLSPPLITTREQWAAAIEIIDRVISSVAW
jgi:4-aminobutyrate aminotransferase